MKNHEMAAVPQPLRTSPIPADELSVLPIDAAEWLAIFVVWCLAYAPKVRTHVLSDARLTPLRFPGDGGVSVSHLRPSTTRPGLP